MAVTTLLLGAAVAAGVVVLLWFLGFLNGVLRGEETDEAAAKSAGQIAAYVGAAVGVAGMGLVGFADVLDVVLNGVAASPVVVGNLLVGLVGGAGIAGVVEVSLIGFAIIVIAITGFVLMVRRARAA